MALWSSGTRLHKHRGGTYVLVYLASISTGGFCRAQHGRCWSRLGALVSWIASVHYDLSETERWRRESPIIDHSNSDLVLIPAHGIPPCDTTMALLHYGARVFIGLIPNSSEVGSETLPCPLRPQILGARTDDAVNSS